MGVLGHLAAILLSLNLTRESEKNLLISTRQLSRETGIPPSSVVRCLKELQLYPFKFSLVQELSKDDYSMTDVWNFASGLVHNAMKEAFIVELSFLMKLCSMSMDS